MYPFLLGKNRDEIKGVCPKKVDRDIGVLKKSMQVDPSHESCSFFEYVTHYFCDEGMRQMSDKKRKDKSKSTLSSMQEVIYSHEFKMADQAGGFTKKKARH